MGLTFAAHKPTSREVRACKSWKEAHLSSDCLIQRGFIHPSFRHLSLLAPSKGIRAGSLRPVACSHSTKQRLIQPLFSTSPLWHRVRPSLTNTAQARFTLMNSGMTASLLLRIEWNDVWTCFIVFLLEESEKGHDLTLTGIHTHILPF